MALTYVKLANVTADVAASVVTRAALLAAMEAGETKVVNIRGRILTATEMANHLDGRIDGEAVAAVDR